MSATEETGHRLKPKSIVAAASGNVLEWYDFTVYGFLAPTLATLFFPSEDRFRLTPVSVCRARRGVCCTADR